MTQETSPPSLDPQNSSLEHQTVCDAELPPLPETDYRCLSDLQSGTMPVWTEHAMREYALAAIATWNRRAAPGGQGKDLHAAIMRLPCNVPAGYPFGSELCVGVYKQGHRDARHAAAELAVKTPTHWRTPPPPPQLQGAQPPSTTGGDAEAVDAKRLTQAVRDVLAERQRQIDVEGWDAHHDDEHQGGEGSLAAAAAAYAIESVPGTRTQEFGAVPKCWPWERQWWKPSTPRRMLVKAAALVLAEIERLDRAAIAAQEAGK
jgi:hypothetical protein